METILVQTEATFARRLTGDPGTSLTFEPGASPLALIATTLLVNLGDAPVEAVIHGFDSIRTHRTLLPLRDAFMHRTRQEAAATSFALQTTERATCEFNPQNRSVVDVLAAIILANRHNTEKLVSGYRVPRIGPAHEDLSTNVVPGSRSAISLTKDMVVPNWVIEGDKLALDQQPDGFESLFVPFGPSNAILLLIPSEPVGKK